MKAKVKQPKLTYIYADAEEKYVKNVVLYSNAAGEVFYDEQLTQKVNGKDLQNLYLKGLVVFNTESQQYLTPTQFTVNGEEGTIDFGGAGSGSGEKKTLVMWLNGGSYPNCGGYLEAEINEDEAYRVGNVIMSGFGVDDPNDLPYKSSDIPEDAAKEIIALLKEAIPHFIAYHTDYNKGSKELAKRFVSNINNTCFCQVGGGDIFYTGTLSNGNNGFAGLNPTNSDIALTLMQTLFFYLGRVNNDNVSIPMFSTFDEQYNATEGKLIIIRYDSYNGGSIGRSEYEYTTDGSDNAALIYEH